jgi:hypothetical protein
MATEHVDSHGSASTSSEEARRPPPVEVPLDENTSTPRCAQGDAVSSATRGGMTARTTIAILAVGVLCGAAVSQVFARSHQSTAPASTTAAPAAPVEPGHDEPTDVPRSTGDTVNDLLAGLDAITQAQIARVTATEGAQQDTAINFLRQQHDDVRTLILTRYYGRYYGLLPYPVP